MMIIEAKNLNKSFQASQKVPILSNVSLSIAQGESIAITGRSGEGKTTLLHILGTLESFESGELWIAGATYNQKNGAELRNKHMGFIFQSFNLLEDFSALENVLMPARIGRQPIDKAKGLALLEQVGLEQRAHFPAKVLSGGERQRVAIARALCNNPEILFADEPSGNLDKVSADCIAELLFNLVKTQKKTLILVTHDQSLAERCDRTLILKEGSLIELDR
jgi:lipoprotein-releasing system ATP-binding protein